MIASYFSLIIRIYLKVCSVNSLAISSRKESLGATSARFYSVDGEYGPGHNSFFTGSDGELMIAYAAETSLTGMLRCDGIRRVHFRPDGTPYFGLAASENLVQASVSSRIITGQRSNA